MFRDMRYRHFLWASVLSALAHGGSPPARPLEVRFFDVGQGDAALVTSPAGKRVLVDAGLEAANVAGRLAQLEVDTIDLAVASHNHADHMGGMPAVLTRFVVRRYLENGMPHTTAAYARTVSALERKRIPVLRAEPRTIDLGDGVTLRVLPGSTRDTAQNDRSIGLVLTYGTFTAVFTGDAEVAERTHWIASANVPRAQVLKVSHHGAADGTDRKWIAATSPCAAVISVGRANQYRHPAPSTITALGRANARVFRTDESGEVVVRVAAGGAPITVTRTKPRGAKADTLRCPAKPGGRS
jgi:competence protein ComEC